MTKPHPRIWLDRLAGITLLLLGWTLVSLWAELVRGVPFPNPYQVFLRLLLLLGGESAYGEAILVHTRASLGRWMLGWALAVAVGVLFGVVASVHEWVRRAMSPAVQILQAVPGLAWIPVGLLLFGIGERATLFMIFVAAWGSMVQATLMGLSSVPQKLLWAGRSLGATPLQLFWRVRLPAATASLLHGLRQSAALGWRVLIAAEMVVGGSQGLGYLVLQSRWSLDFEIALVSVTIMAFVGLVAEFALFHPLEEQWRRRVGLIGRGGES